MPTIIPTCNETLGFPARHDDHPFRVAQSEYPYNPDENNDGYIGLVDLLGLLTLFGSDFTPEELSFNDDAAMLDLGPMYFGRCVVECSRLEGDWKVSDIEGIGAFEGTSPQHMVLG